MAVWRVVVQVVVFVFVPPFLPLLISWRWDWWEGWAYAIIGVLGFVVSRTLAARRHLDLLAERGRFLQHEDAQAWDRVLAPLVGVGAGSIPLIAGLDSRFGWSPGFGTSVKILSLIVLLAGYALGSYALIANRFFSGMVRVQAERGQHVVSWSLPVGAPSGLRGGAVGLLGDACAPGGPLGIRAGGRDHSFPGDPHGAGRSGVAG